MKTISTSKKTIAILLAILMVAAVSTISVFATDPPQVFYLWDPIDEDYDPIPDWLMPQEMVVDAYLDGRTGTVEFEVGPYYFEDLEKWYIGEINSITIQGASRVSVTPIAGDLPVAGEKQTLEYAPAYSDEYYAVPAVDITLWECDDEGNIFDPDDPRPHPEVEDLYINVQ
jgi:hypothetical protein